MSVAWNSPHLITRYSSLITRYPSIEAAFRAGVAGRAVRPGQDQDHVAVTVEPNFDRLQNVAGRFAFHPEGLPAAAPEPDPTAAERSLQRGAVHVAEHPHLARFDVLHDRRDEPLRVEGHVAQRRLG